MNELLKTFRVFDILGHLMPGTLFTVLLLGLFRNRFPVIIPGGELIHAVVFIVFAYTSGLVLSTASMFSFWLLFSVFEGEKRPYLKQLWYPRMEGRLTESFISPPTPEEVKDLCSSSYQVAQLLAGTSPLSNAGVARLLGACGLMALLMPLALGNTTWLWGVSIGLFVVLHVFAYQYWIYYREYVAISLYLFGFPRVERIARGTYDPEGA